jgi:hypothetical protein
VRVSAACTTVVDFVVAFFGADFGFTTTGSIFATGSGVDSTTGAGSSVGAVWFMAVV